MAILVIRAHKLVCVFPMVIWPAFRMGQYRVNDHPYHAPQFRYWLFQVKALCSTINIICNSVWMHVRGSALILSCKLLSLFLNEEYAQLLDTEDTETTFAILGYLFHPTTVIFGPWLPFGWYRSSIQAPQFSFVSLLCLVPAVISLVFSTCVFSIFPKVPGYNWYQAIVETYSFHCR